MHTVGAHIRRTRLARGLSLSQTARRAHVAKGYLSELERGLRDHPSEPILRALSKVLDVDLVAYARRCGHPDDTSHADTALVVQRRPDGSVIIVEMDRRAFLATAGAAGAVAVVPLPDRVTPDVLTALSDRYDWHVRAGRVMPANTVSRPMEADLAEITRVVGRTSARLRPPLLALASRYATHLGWLHQDAGGLYGALYWTDRATDLARAAEWRQMVAYTLARKANILQDEQPHHAAALARAAAKSRRLPASVMAYVAGQEAEAHAHAGETRSAYLALDAARRAADRAEPEEPLPTPQMISVTSMVRFRQSNVDLILGRPESVIAALEPVRAECDAPRSFAHYAPPLALAYARVGEVDAACRTAVEIVQKGAPCGSTTARRGLRSVRDALRPWAGRSDVDDVMAALSA
ncbi:MAG TPA: helix-turn-helix transcriptional regulator [Mycobacteriales bacterium]|nr:helix-turn-helix transcriptional regulator [Mycobacteriales bacterium]